MLTHLKKIRHRFWTNQELMYDYKILLTGIGNRSSVYNFDDTIFSFIIVLWICNKRQKWRQCVWRATWSLASVRIRVRANYSREQFARIIRVSVNCETALRDGVPVAKGRYMGYRNNMGYVALPIKWRHWYRRYYVAELCAAAAAPPLPPPTACQRRAGAVFVTCSRHVVHQLHRCC